VLKDIMVYEIFSCAPSYIWVLNIHDFGYVIVYLILNNAHKKTN